jgi:hypothetical protein
VVLLVVVVVGAVALLRGGGDGEAASTTTTTSGGSSTSGSTETSEPTTTSETPTSGSTSTPTTTPGTSTPLSVPGSTTAPPEGFPEPPDAEPSVTGGIDVPGTVDEVGAFYEEELAAAGYEVGPAFDVGVGRSYSVTGQGVDGQLLLVDLGTGTVSVIWSAT